VLSFGLGPQADVRATDIRANGAALEFMLHLPDTKFPVHLAMAGQHNIRNALAAAAAALAAGVERGAVQQGLAAAANVAGRLQRIESATGAVVFDDSYNANPASLHAAIEFLAAQPGQTWLVLGDMKELGPDSARLHRDSGAAARDAGLSRLLCVGNEARAAVEAFGAGANWFASRDALIAAAAGDLGPGVTVLVKGSRSMGMETVAAALAGSGGEG
jgi:UDP-N-acetylmuramoyl-tripeptide--D-alanyl-D-alanine ligase